MRHSTENVVSYGDAPIKKSINLRDESEEISENARTILNRVETIHDILFGAYPMKAKSADGLVSDPSIMTKLRDVKDYQRETHAILDKIFDCLH